jgi:hypothetical protein
MAAVTRILSFMSSPWLGARDWQAQNFAGSAIDVLEMGRHVACADSPHEWQWTLRHVHAADANFRIFGCRNGTRAPRGA